MILSHKYDVVFRNGKTLSASYDLGQGITVISGRNGAGKSTFLETITANLFGSIAFRQKAEDYKSLELETVFQVKGVTYTVRRKLPSQSTLSGPDGVMSVGTKGVNAAIKGLFGYNFDVFRVSNYIEQGDIEAFIRLRPADRKKLIDQSVGLDSIDSLITHCTEKHRNFSKESLTLQSALRPVSPPIAPNYYVSSSIIQDRLRELQVKEGQRQQLLGWMKSEPPSPGPTPTTTVTMTIEELLEHQQARTTAIADKRLLETKLGNLPESYMSEEDIQKGFEDWETYYASVKKGKELAGVNPPKYTEQALEMLTKQWEVRRNWIKYQELLRDGHHTCPACSHRWPKNSEEIVALGDIVEVSEPTLSPTTIRQEHLILDIWKKTEQLRSTYRAVPDNAVRPTVSEAALRLQKDALARVEERLGLIAELADLKIPTDLSGLLNERRTYEKNQATWITAVQRLEAWETEREQNAKLLSELSTVPLEIERDRDCLESARIYERDVEVYVRDKTNFDALALRVEEASEAMADWGKAKTALQAFKVKVKSHLLPSLRRAASSLLHTMSEGRFSTVEITDDMDIVVDHQGLHTLSGSERTLVSLALRLGLGLVLTSRVFPTILGDEIDASCTDERAEAILDGLASLKHLIGQMVIVSHRNVSGDAHLKIV